MFERLFKRWDKKLSPEAVRQKTLLEPDWDSGFKRYFSTPLPNIHASLKEVELIALDFETTGVDVDEDKILSIGLVPLTVNDIDVGQTQEILVNNGQFVKAASAEVNELTPKLLADGVDIRQAMSQLFSCLAGKVILVHGASIERAFIERYAEEYYRCDAFPAFFLDTLQLEKRFSYQGRTGAHPSYQLNDLRTYYGLPNYHSHSAASDALACAELFTVQYKKLLSTTKLELKDLAV